MHLKGTGSKRSPIFEVYAYTLCRITIKFDVVTHVWRSVYLGVSHASPIIRILLYLCLHPLTKNDQIRHGNTCGRVMFLRSGMPLYLHKYVARIVTTTELLVPRFC